MSWGQWHLTNSAQRHGAKPTRPAVLGGAYSSAYYDSATVLLLCRCDLILSSHRSSEPFGVFWSLIMLPPVALISQQVVGSMSLYLLSEYFFYCIFEIPNVPVSISAGVDAPAGPDGEYSKAICKGDINIDLKLGGSNYLSWAEDMRLLLEAKKLWRIVSNNIPQPDEETGNKKTSKAAWDGLENVKVVGPKERKYFLTKDFHKCKAGPNGSFDDIATAIENMKLEIAHIMEG